ncbi:MAG: hypothetical protein IJN42_02230 [Clostridia bacterium]|nr:hypothetical protein [Clostridia bacterium]
MAQVSCMGFNVLAYGTNGAETPEERYPYVMTTIKDEMPDLIGIQEACEKGCSSSNNPQNTLDWVIRLSEDLGALGYGYSALKDQKGFVHPKQNIGSGLMIFFKKDRFELKESDAFSFPHDPYRYFQWAKLYDKEYDQNILFTNTHFSIPPKVAGAVSVPVGEAYRTAEAGMLLDFWYKNCDENTALFATGDYNSEPITVAQGILRSKQFKPSYLISKVPDDRGTVNVRVGHNNLIPHLIDFCFVNSEVQTVENYYPIVRRFETQNDGLFAGYASDHRAIMTYCNYIKK